MRQKLPTILILMVMVLVGAIYWVDLCYYTDPVSGFILRGPVWVRYLVLALPILMCVLGLRTVGPKAISVMRVQNKPLGGLFILAAIMGFGYGITRFGVSFGPFDPYSLILGILMLWSGVWMILAGTQIITQNTPSPTKSAFPGILAALPYALIAVRRILVAPSSLYRIGPLLRGVGALVILLWFGLLLRSMYVALPRKRMGWLYFMGVMSFLFGTCLELPQMVYLNSFGQVQQALELIETLNMAVLGLVAGCVSVAIAGCSQGVPEREDTPPPH